MVSARLHNQFLPDTAFPRIDVLSDDFKELCTIIAKYGVHDRFRLRLLHRHTTISAGQIMLGSKVDELFGFWTRPANIDNLNLEQIHGHIFSVDTTSCKRNTLFPSEFREGPTTNTESIDINFFTEFADYLWVKGWENVFGLEMIQGAVGKIEFSFDIGSLLLMDQVKVEMGPSEGSGQVKFEVTGWTVKVENGMVDTTGETRCVSYRTGHVKFIDSRITNVSEVVRVLREEGTLVT